MNCVNCNLFFKSRSFLVLVSRLYTFMEFILFGARDFVRVMQVKRPAFLWECQYSNSIVNWTKHVLNLFYRDNIKSKSGTNMDNLISKYCHFYNSWLSFSSQALISLCVRQYINDSLSSRYMKATGTGIIWTLKYDRSILLWRSAF